MTTLIQRTHQEEVLTRMKVEREEQEFKPVSITLEGVLECSALRLILLEYAEVFKRTRQTYEYQFGQRLLLALVGVGIK